MGNDKATANQISYLNALMEKNRWRNDQAPMTRETFAQNGRRKPTDADYADYMNLQTTARSAYTADLDSLTKESASTLIDALKAW